MKKNYRILLLREQQHAKMLCKYHGKLLFANTKCHQYFGFILICSTKGRYKQVEKRQRMRRNSVHFLCRVQACFGGINLRLLFLVCTMIILCPSALARFVHRPRPSRKPSWPLPCRLTPDPAVLTVFLPVSSSPTKLGALCRQPRPGIILAALPNL